MNGTERRGSAGLRARGLLSVLALLALGSVGCVKKGASDPTKLVVPPGMTQEEVEDLAFADDVRGLMSSPPEAKEREALLHRVAKTQFRRCARRFEEHQADRALLCVEGALYLFRAGEMTRASVEDAKKALRFAANEFAKRGDTGRAEAAYHLLRETATEGERADIDGHLAAIEAWVKAAPAGTLRRASNQHSAAKGRRLLEPTQAAFDASKAATTEWMTRALALMSQLRVPNAPPPSREELNEAYRALNGSSQALALHFLRDGDAKGAFSALEAPAFRDHTTRTLRAGLAEAAKDPSAEAWLSLVRTLSAPPKEGDEVEIDRRDLGGTAFRLAWEAFRLDPTNPEAAGTLASVLASFGFDEAIPAIISEAAHEHAGPKALSSANVLVVRAMQSQIELGDTNGVRRTFTAALPILALGELSKQLPEISPSPFRIRALMGDVEVRDGNLEAGVALLEASVKNEPTAASLYSLARVHRHRGDFPKAITALDAASRALRGEERVLSAEMALLRAELLRPRDEGGARRVLVSAIGELEGAKRGAPKGALSALERTEARLLDRVSEDVAAGQAIERALDAASRDRREAGDAFSFLVGRALVQGKLEPAREAFRRAAGYGLEDDDVVYLALWVRHLERISKGATPDPAVARVLAMPLDARWVSVLAAFGSGRIQESELRSRAKGASQRAEADFYAALEARARGQAFEPMLQKVLAGTAPDLLEVQLARDLLEPARRLGKGSVPGLRIE